MLWKEWGLIKEIASIQEVLPMINHMSDVLTVISIIVWIVEKLLQTVPPRLLEVKKEEFVGYKTILKI